MNVYVITILATAIVYFFLIVALHIFGKRELSQISIIDLVFILLISNAVQNAMVNGDWHSLLMGILSGATLFVLNYFSNRLLYSSKLLRKLVEGEPVMLVYEGGINKKNLQREQITMNELEAAVREHGVSTLKEVKLAILETDGNISVVSYTDDQRTIHARKSPKEPLRRKRGD